MSCEGFFDPYISWAEDDVVEESGAWGSHLAAPVHGDCVGVSRCHATRPRGSSEELVALAS